MWISNLFIKTQVPRFAGEPVVIVYCFLHAKRISKSVPSYQNTLLRHFGYNGGGHFDVRHCGEIVGTVRGIQYHVFVFGKFASDAFCKKHVGITREVYLNGFSAANEFQKLIETRDSSSSA